jgi:hypothetical protein
VTDPAQRLTDDTADSEQVNALILTLGVHEWGDKATIEKFLAARGSS